jgi:hypothetical protein
MLQNDEMKKENLSVTRPSFGLRLLPAIGTDQPKGNIFTINEDSDLK